ncbi:MAG TPA: PQQ-binding-like beta-propeller repeat protein [Kofleriaceae bacterium]|nr:PQQ-binding-like beta-propeller repeat protein [Kofleriaceae bacterium]
MIDPHDIPLPITWSAETPDTTTMLEIIDNQLYDRCGEHMVALEAMTGKIAWTASLGERSGEGLLMRAVGSMVVTDTYTGHGRTTELVGVRAGAVAYRTEVGVIVGLQGSCVLGDEVFVIGVDPKGGCALRSIRGEDGVRRVDRKLSGRDVTSARGRLLVLNSFSEPGIVSLDRDGGDDRVVERTPAQEMAVAGDWLLVAARTGAGLERTARLIDLESGAIQWSHPAYGPMIALDDELAVHVESHAGMLVPVARDRATGELRWRGSASLGDDAGTFRFAGSLIAFTHGGGTTLYARDDGKFVAELLLSYALATHGRYLYLRNSQDVFCADASR